MIATIYDPKLPTGLDHFGLTTLDRLDQIAQQVAAGQWSCNHFLGRLLNDELAKRHQRTVTLNLRFARFPVAKLFWAL